MSKFDLILVRLTKVVGLVLGSGIFVYETIWDHNDRPYLYAAALVMMGLQFAEAISRLAGGISGLAAVLATAKNLQDSKPQPQEVGERVDQTPPK